VEREKDGVPDLRRGARSRSATVEAFKVSVTCDNSWMSVCCHPQTTVYHLYGFSWKYSWGNNVIPLHEISLYMIPQTEYMAKENFVSLEIRI
jgi:hypothetical protein